MTTGTIRMPAQKAADIATQATSVLAGVGGGATWLSYLNDNSGAITVLCAIITMLFVGIATFTNWYYRHKDSKLKHGKLDTN